MTSKLLRWSWVLALPISAVLAAPRERAVEVPLNSTGKTASRSVTATNSGNTATHKATATRHKGKTTTRRATPAKERNLSMRNAAPVGPSDDGVYHSVHDWVPRTPTTASSHTQTNAGVRKSNKKHWWSRPQRDASKQQAEEVNR